ncbi:hypothetical protein CROQUDRAFT_542845 [Cronartium quercuum f. sp. fusiforme G11]|uniref:S-adenosyl-L-methionine-dependent methyltransferase n=1 Tax=Cronartium quercuum f. sp. fusiforme G11 TaxID=708437 RepID=A0A9P6TI45_9BASI|nr:hypothetical protein CROQUDRAFT_542845 [Cronartium quercuum f. sp. fusiforme G11]
MGIAVTNEKLVDVTEPYLLDRDSTESRRLRDQHEVLLKAAGGYIPISLCPQPQNISAVLDIGTGNAQWLLGLRQSGIVTKDVELYGIDVSARMMPSVEVETQFGLRLEVCDLCEPFPSDWHGKFDFIHARHVMIWIEPFKWPAVLKNLRQALKPGGKLMILYPGDIPYDSHTDAPLTCDTAPKKLFSSFIRYTESQGLPRCATASLPSMIQQTGFDSASIVSKKSKVNLGGAEPDFGLRPAASRHLDFVLDLTKKVSESLPMIDLGCPSHDDEDGWKELGNEWRSAVKHGFYYDLHIITAQRIVEDDIPKICASPSSDLSSDVSSELSSDPSSDT